MGGRGGESHGGGGGSSRFADVHAFLQRAYGLVHAQAILNIIENAPSHIQELWAEFGALFRAARANRNSDKAYYSPGSDNVFLGIERVAGGDSISTPYSVLFHEYGHMTDYLIARRLGHGRFTAYSDVYGGGLLGQTATAELDKRLNAILVSHSELNGDRSAAANILISRIKRKYSTKDRSDISDMMEGAGIGIAYPLGAGHGLDYWSSRGNSREIFAEITSAEAAHPGSLKAIKEFFPETYNVYRKMLKERK